MVAPAPADPLGGEVVVVTRDEYWTVASLARYAARLGSMASVFHGRAASCTRLASRDPAAQRFLVWSRYPAVGVEASPSGGTLVQFSDVRYRAADGCPGRSWSSQPAASAETGD